MPKVELYNGFPNVSPNGNELVFAQRLTIAGLVMFDFSGMAGPFFVPVDAKELELLKDCDGVYMHQQAADSAAEAEEIEKKEEKIRNFFFDEDGEFKFKNCNRRPRLAGNWQVLLIGRIP